VGSVSDDDTNEHAGRYEWERIVRRCIMPSTAKLVALAMATYANADGTRIFPGASRLAAVTGLSERATRGALTFLRDTGLIVRVYKGGRHGDKAFTDVHHLAIPADILDRLALLDPDETPLPKRQEMPVGNLPNRHLTTPQPARGASQPASDDLPTGTTCTPPLHDQPLDPPTNQRDQSSYGTQPQNARGELPKNVIIGRFGGRAS
jgi:hypothetical protein